MSEHIPMITHEGSGAARIAELERKLAARSNMEKALFDGSWLSVPMLVLVACIWAVELVANVSRGEGWSSTAHLLVIAPLELALLVAVALGLRSVFWQTRLAHLRRRAPGPAHSID